MRLEREMAVKEVACYLDNGGISTAKKAEAVARILTHHDVRTHEVFKKAANQLRILANNGVIAEELLASALSQSSTVAQAAQA